MTIMYFYRETTFRPLGGGGPSIFTRDRVEIDQHKYNSSCGCALLSIFVIVIEKRCSLMPTVLESEFRLFN